MARLLKALNFLLYKAVLPYEAEISPDIELCHYGIGVVIHPNVKIGRRVKIFHEVTLAMSTWIGSPYYIEIGDDVMIGAGAKIIAKPDRGLRIGNGAQIGANAVVTQDVADGETVVGVPARPLKTKSAHNEPTS
ncbi:serine acetyltransferase [Chthonomonas calidirosea]|nr:serine acetyltransferase [Chthonomonas calidirosea]